VNAKAGEFTTAKSTWDAAETTRLAAEKAAKRTADEALFTEAKNFYDEQKLQYDGLVAEIKQWDDLKLVEPDLFLWREYDLGSKEARKRLQELEVTFLPL